MKVLVAGAGAIGQWLGARLVKADHDVTLLARPNHVTALAHGLRIRGLTSFDGPLHAAATPGNAGSGYEAIVITAKAHQTASVGQTVAPLLSSKGILVSLQNGFGNGQKLARHVPVARLAIGLTSHGVTLEAPGRIFHAGSGPTLVGPAAAGSSAAAHTAGMLFRDAGLGPEIHDNMRPFIWRKAIVNGAINPVGALHGVSNGQLASRADLFTVANGLVGEGVSLARRARVDLPTGDLVRGVAQTLASTAENRCSMLQDVAAKRPTEIEQITGRMVRLAAKLGAPLPLSDDVYRRLKALESSYLGVAAADRMTREEIAWESEPF